MCGCESGGGGGVGSLVFTVCVPLQGRTQRDHRGDEGGLQRRGPGPGPLERDAGLPTQAHRTLAPPAGAQEVREGGTLSPGQQRTGTRGRGLVVFSVYLSPSPGVSPAVEGQDGQF